MKIAITGHRHGLGKALYDKFLFYNKGANNTVLGFDLENGYDISNRLNMGKILFESKTSDVFINNAYHPVGQTEVLKYLLKMWRNQEKTIVNIGTFLTKTKDTNWSNGQESHETYLKQKQKQRQMIAEYLGGPLKIIQVNPGYMYTEFLNKMEANISIDEQHCLNIYDCADAIVNALDMLKKNIHIPEIDLLDKR